MSINTVNMYDLDPRIAEIYDRTQTYHDDVDFLLSLIRATQHKDFSPTPISPAPEPQMGQGKSIHLSILEPFCGTGRVLVPLAEQGHRLVGLDQAASMLSRARQKVSLLPGEVQSRVSLMQMDVHTGQWPAGFDLVVLGGNCLYELATPEEQARVIQSAADALKPGGYLYLDNDHMEGDLAPAWREPGPGPAFPSGMCADGTQVDSTIETIWFDAPARLVKFRRITRIRPSGGSGKAIEMEAVQQKHPISMEEQQGWLVKYGFVIEQVFGDRSGSPYTPSSPRAIFWARLER